MRSRPIATAFLLLALNAGAQAVTHHVDAAGGADFDSIGEAFAVAVDGDSIVVAPGTYTGENNKDIEWGLRNLVLTSEATRQNPVIDCEGEGRFVILDRDVTDTTSVIRGFTVINGDARTIPPHYAGGAIAVWRAGAVIEDCVFTANDASLGGAVYLLGSPVRVRSCLFADNTAGRGGAISEANDADVVISDCLFVDNAASIEGGAVRSVNFAGEFPIVRRCTIVRNSGGAGGGVWFGYGSEPTIDRCIVAMSTGGAGVESDGGEASEIVHSIFHANAGGDSLPGSRQDNLFVDPLFCGYYSDDFTLCANSPGLPANNPWGVRVGAYEQGCPDCESPVDDSTWGAIKALYRRPGR